MDELREAIKHFLVASSLTRSDQPNTPYVKIMGPSVDDVETVLAAARRFLALTETGPDYEAATRITRELTSLLPVEFEGSHDAMLWTSKIVDAAFADYLTEEDR